MTVEDQQARSRTMRAVRSSKTSLENGLASALRERGCHARRNVQGILGRPDFAVKCRKTALFVDSCFWHGCPEHCRMPRSNTDYWTNKIARNRTRDLDVTQRLQDDGWTVIRVWEHELHDDFQGVIARLADSPLFAPDRDVHHGIPY